MQALDKGLTDSKSFLNTVKLLDGLARQTDTHTPDAPNDNHLPGATHEDTMAEQGRIWRGLNSLEAHHLYHLMVISIYLYTTFKKMKSFI